MICRNSDEEDVVLTCGAAITAVGASKKRRQGRRRSCSVPQFGMFSKFQSYRIGQKVEFDVVVSPLGNEFCRGSPSPEFFKKNFVSLNT